MTNLGVDVEQKAHSADFCSAKGISFKVNMVAVQPFHHVVRISVGFLDVLDCAITKNDASDDHFITMFWMFCRFMNVEVLAELLFVVGKCIVG